MSDSGTTMKVAYEDVQAHYDLSNEFFGLFQDPTRTYSCAFYESDDTTLEQAQIHLVLHHALVGARPLAIAFAHSKRRIKALIEVTELQGEPPQAPAGPAQSAP